MKLTQHLELGFRQFEMHETTAVGGCHDYYLKFLFCGSYVSGYAHRNTIFYSVYARDEEDWD